MILMIYPIWETLILRFFLLLERFWKCIFFVAFDDVPTIDFFRNAANIFFLILGYQVFYSIFETKESLKSKVVLSNDK